MKKLVCLLLSLMMLTASFAALAEGTGNLIAHYDFEDPANLGKDVSGNGNDLVVKGKTTPIATADAAVGAGAVQLDGECVLASEETAGDFTDSLTSYTVSFYFKHQGYVGEHYRILSTGYNGCQCGISHTIGKYTHNGVQFLQYQPIIGDTGRDFWGRMNEYTTIHDNEETEENELETYHWYVGTFDAETNSVTAWVDGKLCATLECVTPSVKCDHYGVALGGSYVPWTDQIMMGCIGVVDDVRIYDYAIQDIAELGE